MSFWHDMNLPQCLMADNCEYKDTAGCQYTCYTYHALQKLYEYSNLPDKYRAEIPLKPDKDDLDEFKWLSNFRKNIKMHVQHGHGVYLWSPNKGNGKTTWATKLMRSYFEEIALSFKMDRSRGVFVNVTEYIEMVKNSFSGETDEVVLMNDRIARADIVIWDDIGTEMPTNYTKQLLYTHINQRYSSNKSNFFTSNCSLDQLKELLKDDRIPDRIHEQCKPIRLYGESRREDGAWWNTK